MHPLDCNRVCCLQCRSRSATTARPSGRAHFAWAQQKTLRCKDLRAAFFAFFLMRNGGSAAPLGRRLHMATDGGRERCAAWAQAPFLARHPTSGPKNEDRRRMRPISLARPLLSRPRNNRKGDQRCCGYRVAPLTPRKAAYPSLLGERHLLQIPVFPLRQGY